LRYIIELLVEFERYEDAKGVLKRFPIEQQKGPDYRSMDLLIAAKTLPNGVLLQKARDLVKEGIETPTVYEVLIESAIKAGLNDSAEESKRKAIKRWPDQAGRFSALFEPKPAGGSKPGKSPVPGKTA
jgi:hypothetical protein